MSPPTYQRFLCASLIGIMVVLCGCNESFFGFYEFTFLGLLSNLVGGIMTPPYDGALN